MVFPPPRSPIARVLADGSVGPYRAAGGWRLPVVLGVMLLAVAVQQMIVRSAERPGGESLERQGLEPSGVQRWVDGIYRRDLQPLAAATCAGSGCHGGPQPGVAKPVHDGQSAYGLWLERDPHARSWESVSGPAGLAMLSRLGIWDGDRIIDPDGLNNCLACHNSHRAAPPGLAASPSDVPNGATLRVEQFEPLHTEGVACASCHGPAERWLASHYAADFDPRAATADGFVLTRDPVIRARVCASCHVGDHDRDMNHDIIAAGHPALRFEMASHHARLPKHWREPREQDPAALEAELWTAGAIASADAWLALQQGRAQHATSVSTWPELATYDCGSCHQTLRLNSDRRPLADVQQRGSAKMSRWDLAPLAFWAQADLAAGPATNARAANELLTSIANLRQQLEVMAVPPRQEFIVQAAALRARLPELADPAHRGKWLSPGGSPAPASGGLVQLMTLASRHIDPADHWETASHFYLLLAASRHHWPVAQQPELTAQAQAIRRGLSLPAGFDSPRYELRHPIGPELNRAEMTQRIRLFVDTLNGVNVSAPASETPGQQPRPVRVRNGSSTSAQTPAPALGVSDARGY